MALTHFLLGLICVFNLIHCTNKIRCHNNGTGGDESDENDCNSKTVSCSAGDDCQIDCAGYYSCTSSTLNCADHNDCTVNCDLDEFNDMGSCRDAFINCPANGKCTVNCGDTRGGGQKCMGLNINATLSTSLTITGCHQYETSADRDRDGPDSCSSITVHTGVDTQSLFEGNGALEDLTIYNGGDFSNIDFNYNGGNCEEYALGTIYCGDNITSCNIGFDNENNPQCIAGSGDCFAREADTEYILCLDPYTDLCERKNLSCSNNTNCRLDCDGWNVCQHSFLQCNDNYKCVADCTSSDERMNGQCSFLELVCPLDAECVVICGDNAASCAGLNVQAQNSTSLRIENCFCYNTDDNDVDCCSDMNVECPANGLCYIEGRGEALSEGKVTVHKTMNTEMVWNLSNPGPRLMEGGIGYGENCWFNCTDYACSAPTAGLMQMIAVIYVFHLTFCF